MTGGILSAITTHGIALIGKTTVSMLIQGYKKHQNLEMKIQNCTYAYRYQHILNETKHKLRSGDTKLSSLHINSTDNFVTDNAPIIVKFLLNMMTFSLKYSL